MANFSRMKNGEKLKIGRYWSQKVKITLLTFYL